MKLKPPLQSYVITQRFGENDNGSYAADGLKGHTGVDLKSSFNDVVSHSADGVCYKILNPLNPNPAYFKAVYDLVDGGDGFFYEICYGHLNKVLAEPSPALLGQPLGTEGNTGVVYEDGVPVSPEARLAGSTAGFHVHWQVRKCLRTNIVDTTRYYLSATDGTPIPYDNYGYYRDKDNYVYEVVDYNNGFSGCVDPLQFVEDPNVVVLPPSTPEEIQVELNIFKRVLAWLIAAWKGRQST